MKDLVNPEPSNANISSLPEYKILDHVGVPVFCCRRDGIIAYCNQTARAFFGFDALGADVTLVLHPDISSGSTKFTELLAVAVERFPSDLGDVPVIFRAMQEHHNEGVSR